MFGVVVVNSVLVMLVSETINGDLASRLEGEKTPHHRHGHKVRERSRRDIIDKEVEDYLTKFGYLPQSDLETGNLRTLTQLEDAVRNLQGFAGINMTGKIDQQTKRLIHQKRCGVQDVSIGFRNKRSLRVKRYNLQGQRWSHNNLTWSLRQPPQSGYISRDSVRRELTHALNVWAHHTLLTFTETHEDDKADIQVFFHRNYHGDGYPFDGPGSVLAHAFFPGAGRGGDAHFDEDENWSEVREISREVTSLFAVAVHEFGHSLGLSHSTDKHSLMYPWYSTVPQDMNLPEDDKQAIQHLYGAEYQHTTSPPATRPRTRPTRPTENPQPESTPLYPLVPSKCDTNFDAVAVLRGEMWVFKGKYFWRINQEGRSREDPMELSSFWYGLPSDIDHVDAVYERNDHDIVFFVGKKYYIMAGNSHLKYGPLPITKLGLPGTLEKVDGAMRWGYNDKTYFFSGTMYWRFDEEIQHIELDYPRDIAMWRGVPYSVDAVFQARDKKTYFFKDKYFWEFNDKKMEVTDSSPMYVGEHWLHCPKEMHDPFKKAGTTSDSQSQSSQIYNKIIFLFIILSNA